MPHATIKREIDEYGFEKLDIYTSGGGSKSICYFGAGTVDIGTVHSMNPGGLGGSDYIRNLSDVYRHRSDVYKTVWLNDKEKEACIEFLGEIEAKSNAFMNVKERFEVKFDYTSSVPGHNTYTFTEKDNPMTMHTKINIKIEQPSGWGESNAWRALYKVLDGNSKRLFEK